MSNNQIPVGRVLAASTRGFTVGCRVMQPDIPAFGSFVRADARIPDGVIYGLPDEVLAIWPCENVAYIIATFVFGLGRKMSNRDTRTRAKQPSHRVLRPVDARSVAIRD